MKFTNLRDHFRAAALAGALYIPYAAKFATVHGAADLAQQAVLIAGVFCALRVPYAREVPLALTRAVLVPLTMRQRRHDPALQKMVDDMLVQTGSGKRVRVSTYERGITNNAAALGGDIYVGRRLRETMNDEELKFVLAHELSHIEAQDISERYAFWPPFIDSIFTGIGAATLVMMQATQAPQDIRAMAVAIGFAGAAAAYYAATSAVSRYHSRLTEYRADANALRLTKDFPAAARALTRLYLNGGGDITRSPSRKETYFASHPVGRDRLDALAAVAKTLPNHGFPARATAQPA